MTEAWIYTDAELLQKHLIALELLPEKEQDKADMNYDGNLTVTDLSILIRRIEKKMNYEVRLSSATDKFYYEKQEEAELKFYADISCGIQDSCQAVIETVTMNGSEYAAERQGDSSLYAVKTSAGDNPGVKEYRITKVLLDSGQEVSVDYSERMEVLKSAPEVMGFQTEELTDTAQMKVSFVLRDEDSALTSSDMKVLRQSDNNLLTSEKLRAGKNEFTLDLEEDTLYDIYITASITEIQMNWRRKGITQEIYPWSEKCSST